MIISEEFNKELLILRDKLKSPAHKYLSDEALSECTIGEIFNFINDELMEEDGDKIYTKELKMIREFLNKYL